MMVIIMMITMLWTIQTQVGKPIRRRKRSAIAQPKKKGARSRGQGWHAERQRMNHEKMTKVEQALDQLTDPYEEMSIVQKKKHALFLFYSRLKVKTKKNIFLHT